MVTILYGDLAQRLQDDPGVGRKRVERSVIRVAGVDAVDFVHRICSQDVLGMTVGTAAGACFLTPKGKLVALAAVARIGETELCIESASDGASVLHDYLERFHFTEKLRIEAPRSDWVAAVAFGPSVWRAAGFEPGDRPTPGVCRETGLGLRLVGLRRNGLAWVTAHGPVDAVDAWWGEHGFEQVETSAAECLRMVSAQLVVGRDVDESTLALEAPVDDHVSTQKGCYTGQEIVARIHTYGHVNRKVVALRIMSAEPIESGTPLCELEDGEAIGRVTTSAACATGQTLAIGYVPRDFAAIGTELGLRGRTGPRAQVVGFGPA